MGFIEPPLPCGRSPTNLPKFSSYCALKTNLCHSKCTSSPLKNWCSVSIEGLHLQAAVKGSDKGRGG